MLTLKLATTLDGRIATASGESRWITGPGARAAVHRLRACHDAVMVGAGTARADDPMLDVRGLGMAHQPVRIVLDPALSLPLTGRLVQTAQEQPLWLLHRPDPNLGATLDPTLDPARLQALADAGVTLIETPAARDGTLDLAAALTHLAARGLTRILCEGGGRLAAALLAAERVDRLITHSAGALIGAEGVPAIAALGLPNLASAPRFALQSLAQTGSDITATWHPL